MLISQYETFYKIKYFISIEEAHSTLKFLNDAL